MPLEFQGEAKFSKRKFPCLGRFFHKVFLQVTEWALGGSKELGS